MELERDQAVNALTLDFYNTGVNKIPGLWRHQREALNAINEKIVHGSTTRALIQFPTGTGKTRLGAEAAKVLRGHGWWVAHRHELLTQPLGVLRKITGEPIGLEKATARNSGERIVVSSIQTIAKEERRRGLRAPDWIIIDECHRAPGDSYQGMIASYPKAIVVGLTATAHRMDRKDLMVTFKNCLYRYTIPQAIADGCWAPLRWLPKVVAGVRLERLVDNASGDFSDADLEKIASQNQVSSAYAKGWFEFCEDRKTIMFTPGVVSGKKITDYLNAERPGVARFVCGDTPTGERSAIFAAYAQGDFKVLVNVGLVTEGYDDPATSCIVNCRPTKSWSLYVQIIGRGARIHPGKRDCLILDYTGAVGEHKLIGPVDVVAEEMDGVSDAVKEIAKKRLTEDPDADVTATIEEARKDDAEISAMETAMRMAARERFKVIPEFVDRDCGNPLDTLHIKDPAILNDHMDVRARPAAEKDLQFLKKVGIPIPQFLTERQAAKLRSTFFMRKKIGLADYWQVRKLAEHGQNAVNWKRDHAAKVISEMQSGPRREPGQEG